MRHAYLVLAHSGPDHVRRLVAALRHPGVAFYVHVDARARADFTTYLEGQDDVVLVPRVAVKYKAFSMVEATLNLLRAAHSANHDYYSLLSGSDYPIKSNSYIHDFLAGSQEQYLAFWRLQDRPSWQHKVQYHYPVEHISIRDYNKAALRRVFWASFVRLRSHFPKRAHPVGLEPYGGSQWWSLTQECVAHVLEFVGARPDFVHFHRSTESPDEMFFQTVIMNSPFAATVHGVERYERWRDEVQPWQPVPLVEEKRRMIPDDELNLRYIDWSGELTGARATPAVLVEEDLPALLSSPCLLARKFDAVRSAALLEELDRRRAHDPGAAGDAALRGTGGGRSARRYGAGSG
jgi:hypothetical protein